MGNTMLLALITGQRLGDISNIKFSNIWEDQLHNVQEKTGSKIAIRLNVINWSLRDVIARCRDYTVSHYFVDFLGYLNGGGVQRSSQIP